MSYDVTQKRSDRGWEGLKPRAGELRSIRPASLCPRELYFLHVCYCALYPNRVPQHNILEAPCTAEGHYGLRLHLESIFSAPSSVQRIIVTQNCAVPNQVFDRPQTCLQGCSTSSPWTIGLLGFLEYFNPSIKLN